MAEARSHAIGPQVPEDAGFRSGRNEGRVSEIPRGKSRPRNPSAPPTKWEEMRFMRVCAGDERHTLS